ncbi:MAG: IS110 family transposase [Pseudomonadota bacterium]
MIRVIGLDIAKSVFQVHGIDECGRTVLRRKMRRGEVLGLFASLEPAVVGIEACHTAHHWAREIAKLGHEVRLMPPQFVKPYVKSQKNDAADAEAICEAVMRPTMRFVPVKSVDQQAALLLHRTRDLLIRQRSSLISAIRAHFAEFGVVVGARIRNVERLLALLNRHAVDLPKIARQMLTVLADQLRDVAARMVAVEAELLAWHRSNAVSQRLETIPGIGPITATAIVASVGDARQFKSGRQFAAWLGLVPQQRSSGGKERLGGISKRGDGYIRRLLIHGARAFVGWRKRRPLATDGWLNGLLARRPVNVATVAMANKSARIAWALLTEQTTYDRARAYAA